MQKIYYSIHVVCLVARLKFVEAFQWNLPINTEHSTCFTTWSLQIPDIHVIFRPLQPVNKEIASKENAFLITCMWYVEQRGMSQKMQSIVVYQHWTTGPD